MTNEQRIALERKIARAILKALIADGYSIRIHDGEEFATKTPTTDMTILMKDIWSTDEDRFVCYKDGQEKRPWVYIVYGNEMDIVTDWSCSLDSVIEPVLRKLNILV